MTFLKRLVVACAVLFSAGCSLPMVSHAEYDNGISFTGFDGVICQAHWSGRDNPSLHCSLVLHLEDGTDLDESTLASPMTMRGLGAHTRNKRDDSFDLILEKPAFFLGCSYRKGKLESVIVNLGPDSREKASLTANGKSVTLPIKEDGLFEALGKPNSFGKRKQTF